MQDISHVTFTPHSATKHFTVWNKAARLVFERVAEFAILLSETDLYPPVHRVTDNAIVMDRLVPLRDVLSDDPKANRKWGLGESVLESVMALHELGLAHRDLRVDNLVLDEENRVRFIDLELMCRVSGNEVPYDLFGPELSKVERPEPHKHMQIEAFWDSTTVDRPLWKAFGKLETYL